MYRNANLPQGPGHPVIWPLGGGDTVCLVRDNQPGLLKGVLELDAHHDRLLDDLILLLIVSSGDGV
eukprot:377040-Pyramimonas_sp.AAC.1